MSAKRKRLDTSSKRKTPRKGTTIKTKRPHRGALRNLALLLFSVLFSLVLSEVVVRIAYGERFGKRPGFFVGDARLGWKPAANLDHTFFGPDYSIHVRTDADGYRLGALGAVDYRKELVVLCGDSYGFGWGVSTDETFASHLDEQLHGASNGSVRLVNLGVGGYGLIQECDRLKFFLEGHPDARVRAVVVLHSPNDAADNIAALGYHAGVWEVGTKSKPRSRIHLVNCIRYVIEAMKGEEAPPPDNPDGEQLHPYLQDMLFAYEPRGDRTWIPGTVDVGAKKVKTTGLQFYDLDSRMTLQRGSFTRLQSGFMTAAIAYFHEVLKGRSVRVFHAFIHTAPDWYVDAVSELIRKSSPNDGSVVILGKVPGGEYPGPVSNDHSGGHYNPEFSEHMAREMQALLNKYRF